MTDDDTSNPGGLACPGKSRQPGLWRRWKIQHSVRAVVSACNMAGTVSLTAALSGQPIQGGRSPATEIPANDLPNAYGRSAADGCSIRNSAQISQVPGAHRRSGRPGSSGCGVLGSSACGARCGELLPRSWRFAVPGVQPDATGASVETTQGYPDLEYAQLRRAPRVHQSPPGRPGDRHQARHPGQPDPPARRCHRHHAPARRPGRDNHPDH